MGGMLLWGRKWPARHGRRSPRGLRAGALIACGLLLLGAAPSGDPAELPDEFPAPTVQAFLSHAAVPQGGTGTLLVTFEIQENSHIQINEFLELLLPEDAPLSFGPWVATRRDAWAEHEVLKGSTALSVPFTVDSDAPLGYVEIPLTVAYQGCMELPTFACYAPGEVLLPLRLEILPAGEAPQLANTEIFRAHGLPLAEEEEQPEAPVTVGEGPLTTAPAEPATQGAGLSLRLEQALAKGSLLAILLVFLGGVLTSFTPCVYPMIPITISYVGGRARNRTHGFLLSLCFVLGIAIMYSALGLIAASTASVFGSAMQSTAILIVVAAIFTAMGASMLGAFDLALPASLQGRMTAGAQRGGALGAILMGMVTGLVASPCVGPVLVVLLTFVAKTGSLFYGFWLLFTFACGLGLLFLVLGTFAGAIRALPGAGSWMDTVKHVFGVVLIAMAIFYVRSLLGLQWTRLIFGVYCVFVGVFSGALTPLAPTPSKGQLLRKAIAMLIFLSGALIFLLWLASAAGLHVTPPGNGAPGPAASTSGSARAIRAHPGPTWRMNDEGALEEARAAGRPAIQDFYADWCTACVELDEKTWSDPAVIAEAGRFLALKMDFTRRDEFSRAATSRYAVRGMPTVIFYDSDGHEVTRFFGFKGPREVLALMQSIK